MRRSLLVLIAFLTVTAHAQSPRIPHQYTRLLLPFHASLPTGIGTWSVQWWFRNEGTTPVDAFPLAFRCGLPPPPSPDGPLVFMRGNPALPPATTLTCIAGDVLPSLLSPPFVPVVSAAPGALLYVETASVDQVIVGGSVRWVGMESSAGAAELRAIPEGAFVAGTRSILPVPAIANHRYAVRVYALPETVAASARAVVRVYEMRGALTFTSGEVLIATIPIDLRLPTHRVLPCSNACDVPAVPYAPAIAEVFDVETGARNPTPNSTLRIEVVPESPSLRWWAVVSATDNTSREVHLYQPAGSS